MLSNYWLPRPRHCGLDPQSRGAAVDAGEQDKTTNQSPSPLMETFAKPTVIPA